MTTFSFTTKAVYIKNSLEAVEKTRERAVLSVNEEDISFKTVSPQKTSMCRVQLQNEAIEQIDINDFSSQFELSINPSELRPYLSPADKADSVSLRYDENKSCMEGQISAQGLKFSLPIYTSELNSVVQTVPEEQQICRVLNGRDLKKVVKLFHTIFDNDFVKFQANKTASSGLRMTAQNERGRSISKSFEMMQPPTPNSSTSTEKEGSTQSTKIRIDCLFGFTQIFGRAEKVIIYLGDSYPIRFEFTLDNNLDITYIISPKLEE